MSTARGIVTAPQPSDAVKSFGLRLRILQAVYTAVAGFDFADVVLVTSLVFVFVGLALPSLAFAVVGFLLLPLTPIWTNVRLLVRGR